MFPIADVPTFISLGPEERILRFKEFTDIVTGIRVYKYSFGVGGEGVDNRELYYSSLLNINSRKLRRKTFQFCVTVPDLVEEGIITTITTIDTELKELERVAALYTSKSWTLFFCGAFPVCLINFNH